VTALWDEGKFGRKYLLDDDLMEKNNMSKYEKRQKVGVVDGGLFYS
jgi:hypothetical protein